MRTVLKGIVLVLVAIVLIAFAVANRQTVTVSFDPFSAGPPILVLTAPLFLIVFFLVCCGVVIGGVASWPGQFRSRRAAKRARGEAATAQAENGRLRTELDIQSRQSREAARLAGAAPGPLPALGLRDAH